MTLDDQPPVLGVDCSSKKSCVFDGEGFHHPGPSGLHIRLKQLRAGTLICWDAPLTGPGDPDLIHKPRQTDGDEGDPNEEAYAYSSRLIERFFNRQGESSELRKVGLRPPEGVNTRHYTGMSHWAVTRALTGHPRVGPYDAEPRFPLATDDDRGVESARTKLAEVHPAVALWLWIAPNHEGQDFVYKSGPRSESKPRVENLTARLVEALRSIEPKALSFGRDGPQAIVDGIGADHDKLDAYVAWTLGRLWAARRDDEVMQLGGGQNHGTFLLPTNEHVKAAWDKQFVDDS